MAILGFEPVAMLAAVGAYVGLGALWYAPFFLGKPWLAAMGIQDPSGMDATRTKLGLGVSVLAAFVTAVALDTVMDLTGLVGVYEGALTGALCAIGFFAMMAAPPAVFEDRAPAVFAIDVSYTITAMALMGSLIGWLG